MIRTAVYADIPRLMEIRASVRENRLSDPTRVTLADYEWFIDHGPLHVWEGAAGIQGLSAGDPRDGSIWALFVDPAFEGVGVGQVGHAKYRRCLAAHCGITGSGGRENPAWIPKRQPSRVADGERGEKSSRHAGQIVNETGGGLPVK